MTPEEKAVYIKIITQIDNKIREEKTYFLDRLSGAGLPEFKGADQNFLLCSTVYYWKGYVCGLDYLKDKLKIELDD